MVDDLHFEVRLSPSGQVGFFAEQRPNWRWIRGQPRREASAVLNLFAHTGGSTLAAASAGYEVAHVDASRPAVAWARRNAQLSGLADRPIRWLVDDALAFARREVRRNRRYQGVILDPPSYGHGPARTAWQLQDQLPVLLETCAALLADDAWLLLTAHTPGFGPASLGWDLADALGVPVDRVEVGDLEVPAENGPPLPAGAFARFPGVR